MKKLILICAVLVTLIPWVFLPSFALCGCDDPTGKTFVTSACQGAGISLTFEKSPFSPAGACPGGTLVIQVGDVTANYQYIWDFDTCSAAVSIDCDASPIFWLFIPEDKVVFLNAPVFSLQ